MIGAHTDRLQGDIGRIKNHQKSKNNVSKARSMTDNREASLLYQRYTFAYLDHKESRIDPT
jgi:hypothetical protein